MEVLKTMLTMVLQCMKELRLVVGFLLLVLMFISGKAWGAKFVIPYSQTPPTIDGVVEDKEWSGAAAITGLGDAGNRFLLARQAIFFITYDNKSLYFAARSPLREGERLLRKFRDPITDRDVSMLTFDDTIELWIDTKKKGSGGVPVIFQNMFNPLGVILDVEHIPTIGQRNIAWNGGWQCKSSLTAAGRFWEIEASLPLKDIFVETPIPDGTIYGLLFSRNWKQPLQFASWQHTGSFDNNEDYPRATFMINAPVVQLLSVEGLLKDRMGCDVLIRAPKDSMVFLIWQASVKEDNKVLLAREGKVSLGAGKSKRLTLNEELSGGTKEKQKIFSFTVTSSDKSQSYYEMEVPFIVDKGLETLVYEAPEDKEPFVIDAEYSSIREELSISADIVNFLDKTKVRKLLVKAVLDPQDDGKTVIGETDKWHLDKAEVTLSIPSLSPAKYHVEVLLLDKIGKELTRGFTSFEKIEKDSFPWLGNTLGITDKVYPPWTPLMVKDNEILCWNRTYTFGEDGLLRQVTSGGKGFLITPMHFEAIVAGKSVEFSSSKRLKIVSATPSVVKIEGTSSGAGLEIKTISTLEYDGFLKMELEIRSTVSAVKLESLKMITPLNDKMVPDWHLAANYRKIGYIAGCTPGGEGVIWNSQNMKGQQRTIGSFIPYIWLGNMKGGFCWLAENDKGWVPTDNVPAMEIRRSDKELAIVLNLVGEKILLEIPRRIVMSYMATPVKPLPSDFRSWPLDLGTVFGGNLYGRLVPGTTNDGAQAPYPIDWKKFKAYVEYIHSGKAGILKGSKEVVPYIPFWYLDIVEKPVHDYFKTEWVQLPTGSTSVNPVPILQDYIVWNLHRWLKECDIDGIYLDNTYLDQDYNVDAEVAYKLPDGKIQPGYHFFGMREYIKRIYIMFMEQGKEPIIVVHMTHAMYIPCFSFAQIAFDGEDNVIYPDTKEDFMDLWDLDRTRVLDTPYPWGIVTRWLAEFRGDWSMQWPLAEIPGKKDSYLPTRTMVAQMMLHDTFWMGGEMHWRWVYMSFWDLLTKEFGWGKPDVTFSGYWENKDIVQVNVKEVKVSFWKRSQRQRVDFFKEPEPKVILFMVSNFAREDKDVQLKVDWSNLAPGKRLLVRDAETRKDLTINNNIIPIRVKARDFRLIWVEMKE